MWTKGIGITSIKRKLQCIWNRHLISFEVVHIWNHKLYPATFPLRETFFEMLFVDIDSRRILWILLMLWNIVPFKWDPIFGKRKWQWWDDQTLQILFPNSAINNEIDKERHNLVFPRNRDQGHSMLNGFTLHNFVPLP